MLATSEKSLGSSTKGEGDSKNEEPDLPPGLFGEMLQLPCVDPLARKTLLEPFIDPVRAGPRTSVAALRRRRRERRREDLPLTPPSQSERTRAHDATEFERCQRATAENKCIRELRMDMREFVGSLLHDCRYKASWTPVDPNLAPYYFDIIEVPMDITKNAVNVDQGSYPTVLAMVNYMDIIVLNAIQYNPPSTDLGSTRGYVLL